MIAARAGSEQTKVTTIPVHTAMRRMQPPGSYPTASTAMARGSQMMMRGPRFVKPAARGQV
jgi:hypothetical protein